MKITVETSLIVCLSILHTSCVDRPQNTNDISRFEIRNQIIESDIRILAFEFKTQWLTEHPDEYEQVGQATIQAITTIPSGWHVIFEQIRLSGQPEGESRHYLHVFVDFEGNLIRIQRGPDEIT